MATSYRVVVCVPCDSLEFAQFVDAELRNGKMISSNPDAISSATVNHFYKLVVRYKDDPYKVAKNLGIPSRIVPELMANKPSKIN